MPMPKGNKHSDETRKKMSESHKGKNGWKWGDDAKAGASLTRKAMWQDPQYREKLLEQLKGARAKARLAAKEKWKDPEFRQMMGSLKRRPGTGRPPENPEARFMRFVTVLENGCWEWIGKIGEGGYGVFWDGKKSVSAHRWSYEHFCGPIPVGLDLDHTCHDSNVCLIPDECRHRRCVNWQHGKPETRWNNLARTNGPSALNARKERCVLGHRLYGKNLTKKGNHRTCGICKARRMIAWATKFIKEVKASGDAD